MDTAEQIEVTVKACMLRTLKVTDVQKRLHHTQFPEGIVPFGGEQLKQRLAYWIHHSEYSGDAYLNWMVAERLLHSESVLSAVLIDVGRECPADEDCINALAEAIGATLKDWSRMLHKAKTEIFASNCAREILSDKDLACAMAFRLAPIASEYCPSCDQAAAAAQRLNPNYRAVENWLLAETCANKLRGRTGWQDQNGPVSLALLKEALDEARRLLGMPSEDWDGHARREDVDLFRMAVTRMARL